MLFFIPIILLNLSGLFYAIWHLWKLNQAKKELLKNPTPHILENFINAFSDTGNLSEKDQIFFHELWTICNNKPHLKKEEKEHILAVMKGRCIHIPESEQKINDNTPWEKTVKLSTYRQFRFSKLERNFKI